jgi:hypothetical protein
MNSTEFVSPNEEKEKILEVCTKIFVTGTCSTVMSTQSAEVDSYYSDRADLRLFDAEICDYDFATPAELRVLLQKMWEYQECAYMKEFAAVATVAAFRNKADDDVETGIPTFIYQF